MNPTPGNFLKNYSNDPCIFTVLLFDIIWGTYYPAIFFSNRSFIRSSFWSSLQTYGINCTTGFRFIPACYCTCKMYGFNKVNAKKKYLYVYIYKGIKKCLLTISYGLVIEWPAKNRLLPRGEKKSARKFRTRPHAHGT